jgi:serine O-acetyltransferase
MDINELARSFLPCDGCARAGAETPRLPSQLLVARLLRHLFALIFPGCHGAETLPKACDRDYIERLFERIAGELGDMIGKDKAERFMAALPGIRETLKGDITAAYEGDPAARSEMEVVMAYPGFYAVAVHRLAHALYMLDVPILPRVMSEIAHSRTGIDIHPGATIGERFFIDHGTGVVIGETTVIGRNVKLYQGVTLGALSFPKDEATGMLMKGHKRHPNVEDNVVIYAGATILGGETTIGHDSEIGGNVWLMDSIPPYSRVYNQTPFPRVKTRAEK